MASQTLPTENLSLGVDASPEELLEVRPSLESYLLFTHSMFKALRASHLETNAARSQLAEKRREIETLKSTLLLLAVQNRKKRAKAKKTPTNDSDDDNDDGAQAVIPQEVVNSVECIAREAGKSAHVCVLFFSYSIRRSWFKLKPPAWEWDDASMRFNPAFPLNRELARAAELCICIPSDYHAELGNENNAFVYEVVNFILFLLELH